MFKSDLYQIETITINRIQNPARRDVARIVIYKGLTSPMILFLN